MSAKKLQGQVAIITGASRGLGAAIADTLAQAGAAVVLVARDEARLQVVTDELLAKKCNAIGVPIDVSDPEQIEPLFEITLDTFRRIDILVNNAAIVWPLDEVAEADLDEWAYNIHVNLVAPFYLARTVLPVMLAQGYGRVLNISCDAAGHPIPGASAHCAAKAGLDMLTRTMARELAGSPVTVNALYPGMLDTDMQADIRSVDTTGSVLDFEMWHRVHAEGRLLPPMQVARTVYWLVGPWSREHSGEIFDVSDAGWQAQVTRDLGPGG